MPGPTRHSEDSQHDEPAARVRALMFEGDHGCRELPDPATVDFSAIPASRLLWIDVIQPEGLPSGLELPGLAQACLDPGAGNGLGLLRRDGWVCLYVRAMNWRHEGRHPVEVPIVMAIGRNVVLTVHRAGADFIDEIFENEADHMRASRLNATVFAMGVLDRMLTDYLDARDEFETALDRIELLVLRRADPDYLVALQKLRRLASRLRRSLARQRDLFDALGRPDFEPDPETEAARHCHNISRRYDRVMDSLETARELVNGSLELYTSRASEATNQAMHTLTVITVVMGLAATVAGIFGMNFTTNIFESGNAGFWMAVGGMGAAIIGTVGWAVWRSRANR